MPMKSGDRGVEVRDLQLKLLALGYHLPRFGADGDLGDETLAAISAFRVDQGLMQPADDFVTTIPQKVVKAIEDAYTGLMQRPPPRSPVDLTNAHPGGQWRPRAQRPWSSITGITLHQTAVLFGERPERWFTLSAHLGVTRGGLSYLICPLDRIVWHGNGLNGSDVGIEVDGYFEGIEGKIRTFWKPPTDLTRQPLQPSPEQIAATRATVQWICDEVGRNGGQVKFIHAHRQSSADRQSDPGSRIWQDVGIWAQHNLALSDGGKNFKVGTGLKIPEAWDPSRTGVIY